MRQSLKLCNAVDDLMGVEDRFQLSKTEGLASCLFYSKEKINE